MSIVRSLFTGAAMLALPGMAAAEVERYEFDPTHTTISFSWSHFGFSTTYARFHEFEGELLLDRDNPAESEVSVVIDTASLDSDFEERDNHLKSGDFFDVERFPQATFESTGVELVGDEAARVTGDLTIKDVTRPVTLDVELNALGESPVEADTYVAGFDAETTLIRSDFDLGMFAPAVSDEVVVRISSEWHRQ